MIVLYEETATARLPYGWVTHIMDKYTDGTSCALFASIMIDVLIVKAQKMAEKRKSIPKPLGSIPFMLLWMLAHVAGWWLVYIASETLFDYNVGEGTIAFVFGIIMTVCIPITQKWLIRRKLGIDLNHWLWVSGLGWIFGMVSIITLPEILDEFVGGDPIWMYVLGAFTIPAFAQWFVLRRELRNAWVWILAGAVSAFAFSAILELDAPANDFTIFWIFGAAVQGAVTGLSLLLLFFQRDAGRKKAQSSE